MKSGPVTKMVVVVALACAVLVAIRILDAVPARRVASLLGLTVTVGELHDASPTPVPTLRPLDDQAAALSLGTVALQTFDGPALVRSGSGTVVSSDGLIVTTTAAAPYGSGSYVYQAATSGGALVRAHGVWRDQGAGLVLLKVQAWDLDTVPFDEAVPLQAGTTATLTAAFVQLSRYIAVLVPATIPYVTDREIPLSLDRSLASVVAGARVVDRSGRSLGLVQFGQYPRLIPSSAVNAFMQQYLNRTSKK